VRSSDPPLDRYVLSPCGGRAVQRRVHEEMVKIAHG
jgi:hypothetical protein